MCSRDSYAISCGPCLVIAHCHEALAAYKVPKSVRFVDDLPKSPIGKILRRELRAEAVTSETASIETQGRELS